MPKYTSQQVVQVARCFNDKLTYQGGTHDHREKYQQGGRERLIWLVEDFWTLLTEAALRKDWDAFLQHCGSLLVQLGSSVFAKEGPRTAVYTLLVLLEDFGFSLPLSRTAVEGAITGLIMLVEEGDWRKVKQSLKKSYTAPR